MIQTKFKIWIVIEENTWLIDFRQSQRFNETVIEIEIDAPTECVMKCMYEMDDKMEALFPSNNSDKSKKSKEKKSWKNTIQWNSTNFASK